MTRYECRACHKMLDDPLPAKCPHCGNRDPQVKRAGETWFRPVQEPVDDTPGPHAPALNSEVTK